MPKSKIATPEEIPEILGRIRYHFRARRFALKCQMRSNSSLRFFVVVNVLGGQMSDPAEKRKKDFAKAEKITNAAAKDKKDPLHAIVARVHETRAPFDVIRHEQELELKRLVRRIPVFAWAKTVKGFGEQNLACILAETGDLSNYATVSRVWKRLGLAVINGHRQGNPGKGASSDDWIAEGYSGQRRSTVYTLGECILKVRSHIAEFTIPRRSKNWPRAANWAMRTTGRNDTWKSN